MWLLTNAWTLLGGICAWRSQWATCSTVQASEGVIELSILGVIGPWLALKLLWEESGGHTLMPKARVCARS